MTREIDDLDFNSLRSKIVEVMSTGSGSLGYGQEIKSLPVFQGNTITKNQWDGLRNDLINILVHQTGVTPDIIEIVKGERISQNDPLQEYNDRIESAKTTRFALASSQSLVSQISTKTLTTRWNTFAYATIQLTFQSSNEARFFFNSGGKIRISSSRTGGSSSAQNTTWSSILSSSGNIEFGADTPVLNFYQLTNSYQTLFERSFTYPYSANLYRIKALCNVSSNSLGSATSITFEVTWTDNYSEAFPNSLTNPPDEVDGVLSLNVVEVKAAGTLQPSGQFSIISPVYEISNITGGYNAPPPPPPPSPIPAPVPAPNINYREIVTIPSTISTYELFRGTIEGGAPNTEFSVEWKTSSGTITSSGVARLDSSGNYDSGATGVFAQPGTYILTVRFFYTGNVVVKSATVIAPSFIERITVPSAVLVSQSFTLSISGGVPGTGFITRITNSSGAGIISPVLNYLDSSGNFSASFPAGVVPKDSYLWRIEFYGTGNIYYRTTAII